MKSVSNKDDSKKILFCVLNWGLGHASRSIPIINSYLKRGYVVDIASDGRAGTFLQKELPELKYYELPAYDVKYPFKSMRWNISFQWPKIFYAIWKEHQWVEKQSNNDNYSLIITDNRYGCWSRNVKSCFISHQLSPDTGGPATDWLAKKASYWFLNKYDEVWIPDDPKNPITGSLTANPPPHSRFIGFQSRFENVENSKGGEYILAIISGPEPQRTNFEHQVKKVLANQNQPYKIVRGIPEGNTDWREIEEGGDEIDFLGGVDLIPLIQKASLMISRAGYSTIMDLIVMNQKAILIPTPGQYEQELLAKTIDHELFLFCSEDEFSELTLHLT